MAYMIQMTIIHETSKDSNFWICSCDHSLLICRWKTRHGTDSRRKSLLMGRRGRRETRPLQSNVRLVIVCFQFGTVACEKIQLSCVCDDTVLFCRNCDTPRLIEALRSKRVRDIACGSSHSAAIISNGDLYTWGLGEYGRLGHGDTTTQLRPKQVIILHLLFKN